MNLNNQNPSFNFLAIPHLHPRNEQHVRSLIMRNDYYNALVHIREHRLSHFFRI